GRCQLRDERESGSVRPLFQRLDERRDGGEILLGTEALQDRTDEVAEIGGRVPRDDLGREVLGAPLDGPQRRGRCLVGAGSRESVEPREVEMLIIYRMRQLMCQDEPLFQAESTGPLVHEPAGDRKSTRLNSS